jgi:protoheme IX farnesyltransferase
MSHTAYEASEVAYPTRELTCPASALNAAPHAPHAVATGRIGDYVALMKPRVMSLVLLTAFTGLVLAPGQLNPLLAAVALLGIALGAGAAGAINMWYDADIDRLMQRTARRPIPRGRIGPLEALRFGVGLALAAVTLLAVFSNLTAAALLAFTIAFYVFVYTVWLKRRTPQSIVIGGAAGALPPLIGWAAVTGGVSTESAILALIIFMWTPPHFWALSLYRARDYARAGVPMLPVVAGADATRRQILIYAVLLAPLALLPYVVGLGGPLYAAAATALGSALLVLAARVYGIRTGREADQAARRLFAFSIAYLFALFGVLLIERALALLAV